MTDRLELNLREQLLAFAADRTGAGERIPGLLRAMFPAEAAALRASTQERHLEAIRGRLAEQSNGAAPSWLQALLGPAVRRAPLAHGRWPLAVGLVAVSILLVLLVLNMPGFKGTQQIVEAPPGPVKPGPRSPSDPSPKGPVVEIEKHPVPQGPPRERIVDRKPDGLVAAKVEVGEFGEIMGEPTVRVATGMMPIVVQPGTKVALGSVIETGDMDKAEIEFGDGTIVAMDFNTTVLVPSTGLEPGALRPEEIIVTSGRVLVVANHAEDSAPFSVKTPVATATVVGTRFTLALKRSGAAQKELKAILQVEEGRVEFSNRLGSVMAVGRTESSATARSAPTPPRRIPVISYWRPTASRFTAVAYSSRLNAASATYKVVYPVGWTGVGVISAPGEGVRVASVHEASQSQLKVGDHIVMLDGRAVLTADEVRLAFVQRRETPYLLEVERQGERISISFEKKQIKFGGVDVPADLEQALYDGTWPVLTGDPDRAIELLDALTKRTRSAAGFNNLGVAYEMQDDMGMAIRSYKLAVKEAPRVGLYRSNLAGALLKIGNFGRAVEEFSVGLSLAPGLWELVAGQAEALAASKQHPELLAFVESKQTMFKEYASYWVILGRALHRNGRSVEALKALETASEINPSSWEPYQALGLIQSDLGRLAEAERAYRRALEIAPYLDRTLENLGVLLNSMGRYAEAAEVGRRVIASNPKSSTGFAVLGEALMKLGNWPDSEPAFLRAIELEPNNSLPHGNYGVLLRRMGRLAEAETQLRTALRLGPPTPDFHLTLGAVFSDSGRLAEALTETRKAIALDPSFTRAHHNLGNLLADAGRHGEAEAEYRKAILLDPSFTAAHIGLGALLANAGRHKEAETELRKAIALDPSFSQAHNSLGSVFFDAGRHGEAEAEYRKAIELDPGFASAHNNLGNVLSDTGRLKDAELAYRRAVELNRNYSLYHDNLALLLVRAGRLSEAEVEYRKGIDLGSKDSDARITLGRILAGKGDWKEAEAVYREALRLAPISPLAHYSLGMLFEAQGRLEETQAAYRTAIEMAPKFGQVYANLGALLDRQGKLDEAEAVRRSGLKELPNNASLLNALAWNFAERGVKLEEALGFALRATSLSPKDGAILDTLGWVYYKRGDYADAEAHLMKAVDLYGKDPGVSEVWVHLGAVYEKRNEIEKAKDAYRKALSIQPANKEAAEALKRLGG